jgi:hypothetical protein
MTSSTTKSSAESITEPSSSSFTAFVIGQIHCAKLRAQITVNQTEMALTALSAGMITAEQTILILAETGLELAEASS